jgi:hypothetical protein
MSPDPSGEYYANLANPQTLNLYAFVANNPLKYTDLFGLMICACGDDDGGGGGNDGGGTGISSGNGAPNNACVSATPPASGPKEYTGLDWWKAYGAQVLCELTTQVTGDNQEIFLGGSIAAAGGAATGGAGYIVTGGFGGAIVGNAARIRSQCVSAAWGVGYH